MAQAATRSPVLSRILEGRPIRIAENGMADRSLLRRHAISNGDLNEALRQSGVESVMATRLITLEPSGKITVMKAPP